MVLEAQKWDARYGWNLLAEHATQFTSYLVITSPSAWAAVERFFPEQPRHLEFQQGMSDEYLDALLSRLLDAELVVGIGGGNALDVSKFIAWKMQIPLVMIPTIVSTGAVFQPNIAIRRAETWEFYKAVAPECVLFDYGVIRSADPRFNCVGMGECICHLAIIGAWRWWSEQGLSGPPWDEAAAQITIDWVDQFRGDLDENGQPRELGIRIVAEVNRERYDLPTWNLQLMSGLDHVFVIAFQWLLGRELLHAEGVALGTLISNYLHDWRFQQTKSLLDSCHVRYCPRQIGCNWEEVRQVLDRIN